MNNFDFEKNSAVCFIGDSITANGGWISNIIRCLSHYGDERKLKLYNCGVSGTTAANGIERLYRDCLIYSPSRVFVSFGMNDINSELYRYGIEVTDDVLKKRESAICEYAKNLEVLIKSITDFGSEVILLTPTAYDDVTESEDRGTPCNGGLKKCIEQERLIAKKYSCRLIDVYTAFSKHLSENITFDRTHPNEKGDLIVASEILKCFGYDITPEKLGQLPEREINRERYKVDQSIRNIAFVRWYLRYSDKTVPENIEALRRSAEAEGAPSFARPVYEKYASDIYSEYDLRGQLVYLTSAVYQDK